MVRLDKIYTRGGDEGSTSLGDGTRVRKTDPRIEAYGSVDELNAHIGACLDHVEAPDERADLLRLQNELFDLGADLCVPWSADEAPGRLRLGAASVTWLEHWIDAVNAGLAPLQSFVLPGGTPLASAYHLARVVCRRAERRLLELLDAAPGRVGPQVLPFVNRLSDLLFVLARRAAGPSEQLWKPGGAARS